MAVGDVTRDGEHAVLTGNRQWPRGNLAQADLTIPATDVAGKVLHKAVAPQLIEQLLSLVQIYPDAQVKGGTVQRQRAVIPGDAAETVVHLHEQSVVLPCNQQAVWRRVKRLGKFLFGHLQLLLGLLERRDVPHHQNHCGSGVQIKGLG